MTPLILASALLGAPSANDLLPDVSLLASELTNAYISTSNPELPAGTRGLRFSTASVNYGNGRLEVRGGAITGNIQQVNQRVFRDNGTFWDRPAGSFTYHPEHAHIHFDDWTIFRLKQVLPNGGVGSVVKEGAKTSFCIIELRRVNQNLPGHNASPGYNSCGQVQGLRPGWADIYGASLFGQVIDLTGVPDGVYWLEGDIDPNNQILESDETNNQVRIQVAIGPVPPAVPDRYEENDTRAQVNARPEGGLNSPNMGLVLNPVIHENLSMDDADDWYKVKLHAGSVGAYLQVESPYLQTSNLNVQLTDVNGTVLRSSTGSYSWENLSLDGLAAGTYFIRVYRGSTANNPRYRMIINPSPNDPPMLEMNEPVSGTRYVEKSLQTFPVSWNGSDPNNDPKLVSLLRSRIDGNNAIAEPIPGYQDMPNGSGPVNVNTADFAVGRWFILGVGSDGGAQTLSWAPGAVMIYIKGDLNMDGHVHEDDLEIALKVFFGGGMDRHYTTLLDMDRNGVVNYTDIKILMEIVEGHDH